MLDEQAHETQSVAEILPDVIADLAEARLELERQTGATPPQRNQRHSNGARSPAFQNVAHDCQRCQDSGIFSVRPSEAPDDLLVVVERFNVGQSFECWLVLCGCTAGQRRARTWTNMPDEAYGITLQHELLAALPDQDQAVAAIEVFIASPQRWVTLAGGYGVGKTTLIYAALNDLAAQGVYGQYWTAPDLLDYLRAAISRDAQDSAAARLERIAAAPVLAIDELDKYNATEWSAEQIYKLFDTRYRNRRRVGTLLGYNTDGKSRLPPFLLSRMDDGRFEHVEMNGSDVRPSVTEELVETSETVWSTKETHV